MKAEGLEKIISFEARKRHGYSQDFGTAHLGFCLFGLFNRWAGVYQKYTNHPGKPIVRKAFYWPRNPQTPAQQVGRDKFREGVVAWQALTTPAKEEYNVRSRARRISGFMLFMSEYMRS